MVKNAGTGQHMSALASTPEKITGHLQGMIAQELIYPTAVALPKLMVVLLYLHILTNRHERLVAKGLAALITATWFSLTLAALLQCVPFAFNWNKSIERGQCFNVKLYATVSSVPNIVAGLAVLVLPLRMVWELRISVARRVGLLLIFLTGSM